jgi:pimeloyl-ACP methyl ester carboxylesterase
MLLTSCSNEKFIYQSDQHKIKHRGLTMKQGIFETEPIKYLADYGTITVPENRSNPDSRLIEIPVIRIHSPSMTSKEPIFFLSGGPGSSNITFTPPDYMLENHDFILVGYRGADGSSILECPEVRDALKVNTEVLSK